METLAAKAIAKGLIQPVEVTGLSPQAMDRPTTDGVVTHLCSSRTQGVPDMMVFTTDREDLAGKVVLSGYRVYLKDLLSRQEVQSVMLSVSPLSDIGPGRKVSAGMWYPLMSFENRFDLLLPARTATIEEVICLVSSRERQKLLHDSLLRASALGRVFRNGWENSPAMKALMPQIEWDKALFNGGQIRRTLAVSPDQLSQLSDALTYKETNE